METKEQVLLYMSTHTEKEFNKDFCHPRNCGKCECMKFHINCVDRKLFKSE